MCNSLSFILQRANLVISRQLDDTLRPTGLTSRQLMILGAIADRGGLRQTLLAEVIGKDHTTVTANLRPLIRRGLLSSTVDRKDRRARVIALTPEGDRRLAQAGGLLRRFDSDLNALIGSTGSSRKFRTALESLSQRRHE